MVPFPLTLGVSEGSLNPIERQVLEFMTAGNHPTLAVLRGQLESAYVSERESTGGGFFAQLSVPPTAPRLPVNRRFSIGDVGAEVEGLKRGGAFFLFIEGGVLEMLEGVANAEEWPADAPLTRLFYLRPEAPGSAQLVETAERDLDWALRGLR